jgi:hypothetical protein
MLSRGLKYVSEKDAGDGIRGRVKLLTDGCLLYHDKDSWIGIKNVPNAMRGTRVWLGPVLINCWEKRECL